MTPPCPVLARGKTITGRLWTYVRDEAGCWAHARHKFFNLAELAKASHRVATALRSFRRDHQRSMRLRWR